MFKLYFIVFFFFDFKTLNFYHFNFIKDFIKDSIKDFIKDFINI